MTRLEEEWVTSPAATAVFDALGEAYFVGGCVRNALLGVPVSDLDIATPLLPEEVVERLTAAGVRTVPTGIAHGTVTAVVEGTPVEITTFRADVTTDGRRATVAFTTVMATDAARRDFTINALYADRFGTVIDPLGGQADIPERRIRFIGEAADRIREDYLRILRFFRFHAWYGADGIDPDGLAACAALADGVETLARERVGWEIRKLLSAPDPAPAVASLSASGILARVLPGADPNALAPLVQTEGAVPVVPDWRVRLIALGGDDPSQRLRLSRAETSFVTSVKAALASDGTVAEIAYHHGPDAARAAALIRAATLGEMPPATLSIDAGRGAQAKFPLAARDLIAAGLLPGPELGEALARAEAAWIASDFSLDKAALVAEALN
ncbi:MAG: CCA tRNA nucleotidyltransferase [Pseudomonadota bacterium]